MKNVKLLVPDGLTYESLSDLAKQAIQKVFGQFVFMPGTVPFEGMKVVDALTDNSFDPDLMPLYGIDWPILFIGRWEGISDDWDEIIVPINQAAFMNFLPDPDEGEKIFHMPHGFLGWPRFVHA